MYLLGGLELLSNGPPTAVEAPAKDADIGSGYFDSAIILAGDLDLTS